MTCDCPDCREKREHRANDNHAALLILVTCLLVLWLLGIL